MSKPELKDLHDHYWDLLEEKGFSLGQRLKLRTAFVEWSGYKEEYPFIEREYKRDGKTYFTSQYSDLKSYLFETEKEAILANAIYVNLEEFTINEFIQIFKFVCRVIGLKTNWD